jgi:hypothetical protein
MKTPHSTSLQLFIQTLSTNKHTSSIIQRMKKGDFKALFITFLTWLSTNHRGRLQKNDINKVIQSCESWHHGVVSVLSKLARTLDLSTIDQELPQETRKIYEFAFNAELQILTQSQSMQCFTTRSTKQNINDFCYNLTKYLKTNHIQLHNQERHDILILLTHSFGYDYHILIEQQLNASLSKAKINITSAEQLTLADL